MDGGKAKITKNQQQDLSGLLNHLLLSEKDFQEPWIAVREF